MASSPKSTTAINVSGESTIYRSAERCEVSLRISHTSIDQADCLKRVTSLTNELSTHLKTLAPKDEQGQATNDAPVTWFEMSSLNSTSWIPSPPSSAYGQREEKERQGDKEEPKRRYRTTTNFKVKFRDFKKLSEVLGDLGKREDAHIDNLTWRLTDKTRESFQTQARQGAYSDALRKAQDYAQMISGAKAELTCREINDGHAGRVMRSMYASGSHGGIKRKGRGGGMDTEEEEDETIDFQPQEVGISANVNCVFELRF